MDKQSSNKPFFIMPEWAWAIVVGMFMLLLFLNHVIPGHAASISTVNFNELGSAGNNIIFLSVQGSKIYAGDTFIVDYSILDSSADPDDAKQSFKSDALSSLYSLSSFFPSGQFFISIVDNGASLGAMNFLLSILDETSFPSGELSNFPDNFSELYRSSLYSLGQFTVNVWSRDLPLTPTPTPLPPQRYGFIFKEGSSYKCFIFEAQSLNISESAALTNVVSRVLSDYDSTDPVWSRSNLLFGITPSGGTTQPGFAVALNFSAESISNVYFYNIGSSLPSTDLDFIFNNYTGVSIGSQSNSAGASTSLGSYRSASVYRGVSQSLRFCSIVYIPTYQTSVEVSFVSSNIPDLVVSTFNNTYTWQSYIYYLPLYSGYLSSEAFNYRAFSLGLRLASDVEVNVPSPTPLPTSTPVPLPTSGESVHVILPTGTPSPTPPFSVPGGSNGDPGSGSPGSVGSGISAAQSSGILTYFSSFLSNNPALAFIAACFPAIPSEILYPLFILLFILMILAAIRLFVHFAGG